MDTLPPGRGRPSNGTLPPARRRPSNGARRQRVEALKRVTVAIRVVVGDSDPLCRAGIIQMLQQAGAEVVAAADTADDLLRKTRAYRPDVVVVNLDGRTSRDDGLGEAACTVRSLEPPMAVMILSETPDERYALAVIGDRPRGIGLVARSSIRDAEDLTASVRRVAAGGAAIDPGVISRLAGRRSARDPVAHLTRRERQVLALMAQGRSNRFIAAELVVTLAAVERHITSIFSKLDLAPNEGDHRRVLAVLRYLGG